MRMFKIFTLRDLFYITLPASIATVSKVPLKIASVVFANTFGLVFYKEFLLQS